MTKLYFDMQLQAFWKHPKLNKFFDAEAEPVFRMNRLGMTKTDSDSVDVLEGIAYCRSKNNDAYEFVMEHAKAVANRDFSKASIENVSNMNMTDVRYQVEIGRLLHTIFCYRLIHIGGMSLHAAVIVHKDEAIAFCGLSGAGKSTQANLWREHIGSWVLNYDKPAVMYNDTDACMIYGTPWSGKEHSFINGRVPLKAIVFVEQALHNCVERLSIAEAYSMLLLNNYVYPLNDEIEGMYDRQVERLAENVPVYRLYCTKSIEAVRALYCELYDERAFETAIKEGANTMRIKNNFVLRNIAGEYIVIPRGKATLDFQSTILLNETGAFLWELMKESVTQETLVSRLLVEYDISREVATVDVANFIELLRNHHIIEEK